MALKRRLTMAFVCILILISMAVPVSAQSSATKVDLLTTVTADGDCLVTLTIVLRLEENHENLLFPLPAGAKNITMNGSSVSAQKTETASYVDLGRITNGYLGECSVSISYGLSEVVKAEKINEQWKLMLRLPMLNGFEFPIESLSFVITMPAGEMPNQPDFTSIYRQNSFGSDLSVLTNGSQIIGSSKVSLNDHEGVEMTMLVDQHMFPTVRTYIREGNPELVPMLICLGVAVLYWLIFLRALPIMPVRTSTAPEGITAGEMGCWLTMAGADLTTMVFTWAQLGYLIISLDGNGRVLLNKRMDMGNERSPFENKVFSSLFGNRRVVDSTGYAYAKLCHKVAGVVPNEKIMYKSGAGSKKIYRGLLCLCQLFCGINVAMNLTTVPILQILLCVILSIFGLVTAWLIQEIPYRTHLRGNTPVLIGLVCVGIWIILGLLCGQVWIPLGCSVGQILMGFFAAYGGRRSEVGRYDAGQVLGLRQHLKRLTKDDLERLTQNDPDYFFHCAPFALALGVMNTYSKRFGNKPIEQCPYIVTQVHGKRSPQEWGDLISDIANLMDEKERRMQIDKWMAVQIQTIPRTSSGNSRKTPSRRRR